QPFGHGDRSRAKACDAPEAADDDRRRRNLDRRCGVPAWASLFNRQAYTRSGARIMATSKAREDIKNDLKTLKEDLKAGAREETQRLKEKDRKSTRLNSS